MSTFEEIDTRATQALKRIHEEGIFEREAANTRIRNRAEARDNRGYLKRHRRVVAAMAGLVAAGIAGGAFASTSGDTHKTHEPILSNPKLEALATDGNHPNVLRVEPDKAHPGLEKVTVRFGAGFNTLSHAMWLTSPSQTAKNFSKTMENLMTYNGGTEVTQMGGTLTYDVDASTGNIPVNPDLPAPSARP